MSAPRLLLLGGLGMIGRNLLDYIVTYQLCSSVRVVDKQVPEMAYLSRKFADNLSRKEVEFIQADLSIEEHVDRAFSGDDFSIVINLASESQYGHFEMKYERNILVLRTLCAKRAARVRTLEKYIEVSTCQVYDGDNKRPSKESDKTKPWTLMAKYHLAAEAEAASISGLPLAIVRLPIVYGKGDIRGLMPRVVCAAVYQYTRSRMEFLWGEDLRMNTLHVQDAAAAIWHVCCVTDAKHGEIYNVVDDNDTTQGKFNHMLESMFNIETGFYGSIMSSLAQLKLDELVDEANDGHLAPWNEMLRASKIVSTPLNPYLEKELLYNNPLNVDGTKLRSTGFQCSCPQVTKDLLVDSVEYWRAMGLFPAP